MAQFVPPPKAVSRAVAHHGVEEIWCFVSGHARMWRRLDGEEITEVGPGVSNTVLVGTHFQFRCDNDEALLTAIGTTMLPWPGEAELKRSRGAGSPPSEARALESAECDQNDLLDELRKACYH